MKGEQTADGVDASEARRRKVLARAGIADTPPVSASDTAPMSAMEKLKVMRRLEIMEQRLDTTRYLFCLFLGLLTGLLYQPGEKTPRNQLTYLACLLAAFHVVMRVYSMKKSQERSSPDSKATWFDTAERAMSTAQFVGRIGQNVAVYVVAFVIVRSLLG